MPKAFVALLRGINVGKAKRIAMADLRALIAGLGFVEVRTLLNSGNAVFRGDGEPVQIAADIEKAIVAKCGFSSRVTVLTADELQRIVDEDPFQGVADDPSRYLVAILQPDADLKKFALLMTQDFSPELLSLEARAVYLWCARGILESGMLDLVGKTFGEKATTRNWATLGKLTAMVG